MVHLNLSELHKLSSQYESTIYQILKELIKFPTIAYRNPQAMNEYADHLEEFSTRLDRLN